MARLRDWVWRWVLDSMASVRAEVMVWSWAAARLKAVDVTMASSWSRVMSWMRQIWRGVLVGSRRSEKRGLATRDWPSGEEGEAPAACCAGTSPASAGEAGWEGDPIRSAVGGPPSPLGRGRGAGVGRGRADVLRGWGSLVNIGWGSKCGVMRMGWSPDWEHSGLCSS